MESKPKIIHISLPEYNIDSQPDYVLIGVKIDKAVAENFEDGRCCYVACCVTRIF